MKRKRIWFCHARMGQLRKALRAGLQVLAEEPLAAGPETCSPGVSGVRTPAVPSWEALGTWLKDLTKDSRGFQESET